MLGNIDSIYRVRNNEVEFYRKDVALSADETVTDAQDAKRPLWVEGLSSTDFGLFITMTDIDDTETIPFLVTDYDESDGVAIIVPSDTIEYEFDTYATESLARRIQGIPAEELANFSLTALAERLQRKFSS